MNRYTLVGHIDINGVDHYEEIYLNKQLKHNLEDIDYITSSISLDEFSKHFNNRYNKFEIFYNYNGIKKLDVIFDNVNLKNISKSIMLRKSNNEKNIKLDRNLPSYNLIVDEFFRHIKDEHIVSKENKYTSYIVKQCIKEYLIDIKFDQMKYTNKQDTLQSKETILNNISSYKEIRGFIAYLQNQKESRKILDNMIRDTEYNKFKKNNTWYERTTDNDIDPDEEAYLSEEELNQMYGEESGKHL